MKTIAIIGMLAMIVGVGYLKSLDLGTLEVIIEDTATTTEEVVIEPVYPESWLQEAEEAAQAVLRRKELEHELGIKKEQKEALEAEIEALEKELGLY